MIYKLSTFAALGFFLLTAPACMSSVQEVRGKYKYGAEFRNSDTDNKFRSSPVNAGLKFKMSNGLNYTADYRYREVLNKNSQTDNDQGVWVGVEFPLWSKQNGWHLTKPVK